MSKECKDSSIVKYDQVFGRGEPDIWLWAQSKNRNMKFEHLRSTVVPWGHIVLVLKLERHFSGFLVKTKCHVF